MWDESGRHEEIVCVERGKSVEDACGHLLALLDVTFSCCEGGVACDHWADFRTQVTEALSKFLADGSQPRWEQYEVSELWERLQDEVDADGHFNVPGSEFVDLMACAF